MTYRFRWLGWAMLCALMPFGVGCQQKANKAAPKKVKAPKPRPAPKVKWKRPTLKDVKNAYAYIKKRRSKENETKWENAAPQMLAMIGVPTRVIHGRAENIFIFQGSSKSKRPNAPKADLAQGDETSYHWFHLVRGVGKKRKDLCTEMSVWVRANGTVKGHSFVQRYLTKDLDRLGMYCLRGVPPHYVPGKPLYKGNRFSNNIWPHR